MSRSMVIFMIVLVPILAMILAFLGFLSLHTNMTGWFLLLMGLAYAVGGPLYVWIRKGEPPARREEFGDRSFWLLQPGFFLVIFGAPVEFLYLPQILPRWVWMQAAGLVMILSGIVLLSWARRTIKGQFSGHLQIQKSHQLVQSGPYRYLRHPGYLGYLLLAMGLGIGYSSLVACIATFVLLLPGLVYRIKVEEGLLFAEFGDSFLQYAALRKRLIPGIW